VLLVPKTDQLRSVATKDPAAEYTATHSETSQIPRHFVVGLACAFSMGSSGLISDEKTRRDVVSIRWLILVQSHTVQPPPDIFTCNPRSVVDWQCLYACSLRQWGLGALTLNVAVASVERQIQALVVLEEQRDECNRFA
jgi:hypothetical protein